MNDWTSVLLVLALGFFTGVWIQQCVYRSGTCEHVKEHARVQAILECAQQAKR